MSIIRFLALLSCLMSVGCGGVALSSTRPTADTRTWKTYRVQVDDQIVQFTVPPGESKDFPFFAIPQKIDFGDVFDDSGQGPALLTRYWDYRKSRFVAADGTLSVGIDVSLAWQPLGDEESLRVAVAEAARRFDESNGRGPGLQDRPVRYTPVVIGGRSWLRVKYRLSGDSYVTPLDDRHYLGVSISAGGFTRQDWRADAEAAAHAILQSIRILPLQ